MRKKEELNLLERILNSNETEFLAVYGRRGIGKNYLIENLPPKNQKQSFLASFYNEVILEDFFI